MAVESGYGKLDDINGTLTGELLMAVDLEARMLAVQPFHDVMASRISVDEYEKTLQPLYKHLKSRGNDIPDPAIEEVMCWTEVLCLDLFDYHVDAKGMEPHVREHVDILIRALNSDREHISLFDPLRCPYDYYQSVRDTPEFFDHASWPAKLLYFLFFLDIRDLLRMARQRLGRKDK